MQGVLTCADLGVRDPLRLLQLADGDEQPLGNIVELGGDLVPDPGQNAFDPTFERQRRCPLDAFVVAYGVDQDGDLVARRLLLGARHGQDVEQLAAQLLVAAAGGVGQDRGQGVQARLHDVPKAGDDALDLLARDRVEPLLHGRERPGHRPELVAGAVLAVAGQHLEPFGHRLEVVLQDRQPGVDGALRVGQQRLRGRRAVGLPLQRGGERTADFCRHGLDPRPDRLPEPSAHLIQLGAGPHRNQLQAVADLTAQARQVGLHLIDAATDVLDAVDEVSDPARQPTGLGPARCD